METINRFFGSTSLHGFQYLQKTETKCVKIVWFLLVCGGFIGAGLISYESFIQWEESPTITTLASIAAPISNIQFPTVTVCPEKFTPPDNWALPQVIFNSLAFECYDKDNFPDCEATLPLRKEFKGLLNDIFDELKRRVGDADFNVPGVETSSLPSSIYTKLAKAFKANKITPSDAQKLALDNFGRQILFSKVLKEEMKGMELEWPSFCNKQCQDAAVGLARRIYYAGDIMLKTSQMMPFGNLLRTFLNLTNTQKDFNTFGNEQSLNGLKQSCGALKYIDIKLHDYLMAAGHELGINNNSAVSLFDVPSMFALYDDLVFQKTGLQEGFIYTHCKNQHPGVKIDLNVCFSIWKQYQSGAEEHPCKIDEKCCHFWSKIMDHDIKTIMRIMRLPNGRGNNVLDVSSTLMDLLDTSSETQEYQRNPIGTGFFQTKESFDYNSFLMRCSYAKNETSVIIGDANQAHCNLFEPVLTDLGICYGFNARTSFADLQESFFKEAFEDSYKDDFMKKEKIRNGIGAGSKLALELILDNGALMMKGKSEFNFNLGISSAFDIFDFRGTAQVIKPGYIVTVNVQAIAVVATENLRQVSIEKRKCRFLDEFKDVMEIFNIYSNAACRFECMLKLAREFCGCTPWNMPYTPTQNRSVICDLYGNKCFDEMMEKQYHLEKCTQCLPDCQDLKFTTSVSEAKIDKNDFCQSQWSHGMAVNSLAQKTVLTKKKFWINPLIYKYSMLPAWIDSKDKDIDDDFVTICKDLVQKNIAIVHVKFSSSRYMKTVMDRRQSIADKVGNLGGTLSLFTGMSFLSMAELIFWFVKLIHAIFKSNI